MAENDIRADYFHPRFPKEYIEALPALALAHVGDAVFELMARCETASSGRRRAGDMHARTVAIVRAEAQADAAKRLLPVLSEAETDIFRRGRNAKHKTPHGASTNGQYALATGLEALFGSLYLAGETERLNELFHMITDTYAKGDDISEEQI